MARKLAYTAVVLLPAMCLTAGCGEPPPPPPEAAGENVDELEALMEGIELGSETGAPDSGVPADAATPGETPPADDSPEDGEAAPAAGEGEGDAAQEKNAPANSAPTE